MPYAKSHMFYDDYTWSANIPADNFIPDNNHRFNLNRTEGYEILYFINRLAATWQWSDNSLASYQQVEKIIRTEVPDSIRTYEEIKRWIESNYCEI